VDRTSGTILKNSRELHIVKVPAIALLAALGVSAQAPPTKVGTINIQQAIIATKDGQKAAADLQARFEPRRKEFEKRQGEIAGLQEQFRKAGTAGSDELKARLTRDIDQRTKALNRDTEDAQAEWDQEQQKVLNEIGGRLMQVIDKHARDNAYTIILDVSSPQTPVLYIANGIDLTNDIVKVYDANAPSSIPAPSAAKPAATPMAPPVKPVVPPPTGAVKKQPGAVK